MRTRLDGARLLIEQAAALVKMQAWTFSYRALMGSAPGSEDAVTLIHNLEALNAITGNNITLTDVPKLRALMKAESGANQPVHVRPSPVNRDPAGDQSCGTMVPVR